MDHLTVPELASFEDEWQFSPVVRLDGLLLLSGVTGTTADGTVAADPVKQFEQAFEHLRLYLAAASAGSEDVAAIVSCHVGLRAHLDKCQARPGDPLRRGRA